MGRAHRDQQPERADEFGARVERLKQAVLPCDLFGEQGLLKQVGDSVQRLFKETAGRF